MSVIKNDGKFFLAINYGFPGSVVFSQLIEYTLMMREYGISFDYNFMLTGSDYLNKRDEIIERVSILKSKNNTRIKVFPSPFANRSFFLKLYSFYMRKNNYSNHFANRTIIHPRGILSCLSAYYMKKADKRYNYLYDMRGDMIAEHIFKESGENKSVEYIERGKKSYIDLEGKLIRSSGHVICVSNVLKEIILNRYPVDNNKITVIPCCADGKTFNFDNLKRSKTRKRLGFDEKFVIIYSGGLNRWHCAEETFQIMGRVLTSVSNSFFVVLTQNQREASSLADKYLPKNMYTLQTVSREEVPDFMVASDMGIILRHRDPLNESASPTKIAEYLLSGLPVIISSHIGDYSQFINENNLGLVLPEIAEGPDKLATSIIEYIKKNSWPSRKEISQISGNSYSKNQFKTKLRDIYLSL